MVGKTIEIEDTSTEKLAQVSSMSPSAFFDGSLAGYLIPLVAGLWSLFQLALPKVLLLSSEISRSIHLGFALLLVYLSFPFVRKKRVVRFLQKGPRFLKFLYSPQLGFLSLLLAGVASLSALYLTYDYEGIGSRSGIPNTTDMVMGILLLVFLLEGARRALGPVLPSIASLFIIYSFFSEHMPEIISF